jgi:hypothetical protein
MNIDPLDQKYWNAFPTGYLPIPGTTTVGGQQVLRGKEGQALWYWPKEAWFSQPGQDLFDEVRSTAVLFPDLTDDATWAAVLRLLAQRVGLGTRGLAWVPKACEVRDRARSSFGKGIAGWTLHTMTRRAMFPIPDVKDETEALLRAIAMTNCECGKGSKRNCPLHGDSAARPWR